MIGKNSCISLLMLAVLGVVGGSIAMAEVSDVVVKHVKVYYEPGRFGGWPANHGIWSWGNEILVGFGRGYYKDLGDERHNMDRERPEEHLLARSLDGGETWTIENPSEQGVLIPQGENLMSVPTPGLVAPKPIDCPGGIDFTHPDFAMTLRMFTAESGASNFYYSYDRGKSWKGPFLFPGMDLPGIAARTNYSVNGKHDCTVFLSTDNMPNGKGDRSFCARTTDGGKTWQFISWLAPKLKGYAIMPAAVTLSDTAMLSLLRRNDGTNQFISAHFSRDNGQSWEGYGIPVENTGHGNPPSLITLQDGRLCLTYGYRAAPYSICAKLSSDNGRTWSEPIVLRDDGGNRDLGYLRSVQRPDGKVVSIYYFWDKKTGPERYIAATLWDPGKVQH